MATEMSSFTTESLLNQDRKAVVSMNLFISLLCACVIISHLLRKNRWINESIIALAIGLGSGIFILFTTGGKSSHLMSFSEDVFFNYVLPPIIFNAGFNMKRKQFVNNVVTIMMFGVFGTFISFAIISFGAMHFFEKMNVGPLKLGDYLAIGAIFSATDSVCTLQVLNQDDTPLLYSLVFGEGVINDATSVVLFNAIQRFDLSHIDSAIALKLVGNFFYLFVASTLLGVFVGLISAYTTIKLYDKRREQSTDREVATMILMAYMSYMLAELLDLSAILTVFICGIVMSHYAWYNLNMSSRTTTRHTFRTLSFVAEIFIFIYVGMDALDIEKWKIVSNHLETPFGVSSVLLALILVGRAASVFPLSFLSNLTKESSLEKLNLKQQVTIWWSGLMRGAVSMALSYNQFTSPEIKYLQRNAVIITSTITVVLSSTMVIGLITKPLVRLLFPSEKRVEVSSHDPSTPKSLTAPLLPRNVSLEDDDLEFNAVEPVPQLATRPRSLRMLLNAPSNTIHWYWRRFDDELMKPTFGGRGFSPCEPGTPPSD